MQPWMSTFHLYQLIGQSALINVVRQLAQSAFIVMMIMMGAVVSNVYVRKYTQRM